MLKNLLISSLLFLSTLVNATYIYESNQSLIDLTGLDNTTSLAAGDDQVSNAFNLGFTFDYYGQAFTQARVATNGCLHFKTSGAYCNDYTPDPLTGQHTYTLYPLWTDLIRDNDSQVLAKSFTDKTVFGWYNMREYNRSGSDNSFEVILWTNDTFEFRYGALDIMNHDVLIGEQGSASETYTYLFHDECSTGTTNVSGTCVNTNWNDTSSNTALENGGSLYGVGSGNATDCSDPLNDASCSGYAAAYLTQQCNLTQLYSETCPNYWEAYDDQQCADDAQYAPFCAGYTQEASVAFFDDTNVDYGYDDPNTHDDPYAGMEFTDEEWYEIDVEEFGQEQVDDWYGAEVEFSNDGTVVWDSTHNEDYQDVDVLMDTWDIQQEEVIIIEETYLDPVGFEPRNEFVEIFDVEELINILEFETIIREEIEHAEVHEEFEEEEFETMEELEEWFEEEMAEHEEVIEEQQLAEDTTNNTTEREEAREEEVREEEAREEVDELFAEEDESRPNNEQRSSVRISALSVVASTIRAASSSVNVNTGTRSANVYSGSSNSNSYTNTASGSGSSSAVSSSSGGVSTSSSPSRSDQIASANVQTQQVLSMSSGGTGDVTISISPMPTVDDSPQMVMAEVQVQDMQGDIDTAVSGVMTASEADQVADQIVAQNIEAQQEQAEEDLQETGEYGDQSALVAYLGYVPGFNAYKDVQLQDQTSWYEPRDIYSDITLSDNTEAFYQLAGTSLNTLGEMINLQPNL